MTSLTLWLHTFLVNVQKKGSVRSATASARVLLGPVVYKLVAENKLTKGDVLTVAKLAGA